VRDKKAIMIDFFIVTADHPAHKAGQKRGWITTATNRRVLQGTG
jgi:hypothetical protein